MHALVADLAAALGVEGSPVEDRRRPPRPASSSRDERRRPARRARTRASVDLELCVAEERRASALLERAQEDGVALDACPCGSPGALAPAARASSRSKPGVVDAEAALPGQLLGEVEGEAVGVVEAEDVGARRRAARGQRSRRRRRRRRDGLLEA